MRHDERASDSPEAIRADIEQTRAQMSTKIDTIQERLDPDRLKAQAQDAAKDILHEAQDSARQVIHEAGDTISEYVEDGVHSMTTYVREHREEIGRSVIETVKQNPIPTALIGLGLGWLLLRGMNDDDSDRDNRRFNRRRFQDHDTWEREMLRGRGDGSRIYTTNDLYDDISYEEYHYGDYDPTRPQEYQSPQYQGQGYQGQGYQGQGYQGQGYGSPESHGTDRLGFGVTDASHRRFSGQTSGRADSLYRGRDYERNRHTQDEQGMGDRIQEMGQEAAEKAQHMGEEAKHKIQDAGQELKHRVEDTGKEVAHQAQEFTERIRETGEEVIDRAQEMGHDAYRRTEEGIHMMSDEVSRRSAEMGRTLHRRGRRLGRRVHHGLEDNPLSFGLMAFATGAALAMLLPQTRTENRLVGEYRDEFVDNARDAAQSAMHHAQNVYEEVRPELEESVNRLASEVREVGESAVKDVQQVAEKAKDKAKTEAEATVEEVKQKNGAKTDKAHSSTGIANNQTNQEILKGRWNQLKGEIKQKWGKLTDDDMTQIEGNLDKFIGRMQTRYGYSRERAQQEVNRFLAEKGS